MNPLYEAHLQHASGLKLRAVSARALGDATPRDLSGEGLGVELRVALGARDPRRLRESLDAAADWMEEGAATAPLALHVAAGWATLAITDPATRAEAAAEASQAVARGLAAESNDPLLRR